MQPELAAAADLRGGVFTRAEAIEAGYTPGEVRARLRRGTWVALRRGIYASSTGPDRDRRRAAAALAVLPPSAALSHRSAAVVHGVPVVGPDLRAVEVTVPGAAARTRRGLVVHGRALPADQVDVVGRLRVTDPARTAVDLARVLPFPHAVAAVDAVVRAKPGLHERIACMAADDIGPRSARARRVVAFADGSAESVGESLSRVAVADHGLPAPRCQVWLGDGSEPIGRVDFLWADQRTVGEFDGRVKYTTQSDLWAEKIREDRLRAAGFEVVRWT